MLEYDVPYSLGKRTFFFYWIKYGWYFTAIGIVFLMCLLSLFTGGAFGAWVEMLITNNPEWYLDTWIIAQPLAIAGFSFLLVGVLRAYVMHRQFRFILDVDALHYKEGIFRIKEVRIPYMQIANVDIEQPYHYRMVGLAKIDITLSSNESPLRLKKHGRSGGHFLPMIDKKRARELSDHIIRHASGQPRMRDRDDWYDEADEEDIHHGSTPHRG